MDYIICYANVGFGKIKANMVKLNYEMLMENVCKFLISNVRQSKIIDNLQRMVETLAKQNRDILQRQTSQAPNSEYAHNMLFPLFKCPIKYWYTKSVDQ